MSLRFRLTALAATLFVFAVTDTAAAQIVVLSARGPSAASYPQGSILPAKRLLLLRPGDRIEVLDATGQRTITGPGSVAAGRAVAGGQETLLSLFRQGKERRPGIAAARGAEGPGSHAAPGLWQMNVARGGNFCVQSGQTPSLWRDLSAGPAQLVVIRAATGENQTLVWTAGAAELAWPPALPMTDKESYQILLDDHPATTVHLHRLTGAPAGDLTALASQLLDKGCYAQLDSLQAVLDAAPAG